MTSARDLRDELVRLTKGDPAGLKRRISIESVVDGLFYRLLDHPHELDEFEPPTWAVYEKQRSPVVEAQYVNRNVELSWPAPNAIWQWPPNVYSAYDAMVARQLPGIRVLGECWGMSSITHPKKGGGILLSGDPTAILGPRVRWTPDRTQLRCLLGATWGEVNEFLEQTGTHSLPNQPGFEGLTVAGSIGTGGHGSGLGLGPLASMVTRILLGPVTPGGAPIEIDRHHPDFDYVATHLGRLGPVVEVDLAVRRAYKIAEERQIRVLGRNGGDWRSQLYALVDEAVDLQAEAGVHSTEIWIAPYVDDGELVTALGIRRYTDDPLSTDVKRPAVLRCEALQALGRFAAIVVASLEPKWIRWVLRRTVKATRTSRVVVTARHGLDFGAPNVNRMRAMEMAIDISRGVDVTALVKAIEKLESLAAKKDRYVFAPMGVRFVGAGPAHGLAPQSGRAQTMHIEVPTFADEGTFHADEVLAHVQRTLAKLGGRPHWGQRIYLSTATLTKLWPREETAGMKRLVQKLDPKNLFASRLLDPVLGIG